LVLRLLESLGTVLLVPTSMLLQLGMSSRPDLFRLASADRESTAPAPGIQAAEVPPVQPLLLQQAVEVDAPPALLLRLLTARSSSPPRASLGCVGGMGGAGAWQLARCCWAPPGSSGLSIIFPHACIITACMLLVGWAHASGGAPWAVGRRLWCSSATSPR
jgi:hypothetical protein